MIKLEAYDVSVMIIHSYREENTATCFKGKKK